MIGAERVFTVSTTPWGLLIKQVTGCRFSMLIPEIICFEKFRTQDVVSLTEFFTRGLKRGNHSLQRCGTESKFGFIYRDCPSSDCHGYLEFFINPRTAQDC